MELTKLGFIEELQKQDRGYYKLLLSCPIAYDRKTLRFNIWNERLILTEDGEKRFDQGDAVCVNYHLKDGKFPTLDLIHLCGIDLCSNCGSANEVIDAQRMECNECSSPPSENQPERVSDQPMRLMSSTSKQYLYSSGYRIELLPLVLQPTDNNPSFVCVIFPKHLVYEKIPTLSLGMYTMFLVGRRGTSLKF